MNASDPPSASDAVRNIPLSCAAPIGAAPPFRQSKILVVEDHPLVRDGILALLRQQPDLICCGEANSIFTTLTYVALKQPDLVLLDLRLQDAHAFDLIRILHLKYPRIAILVLSQSDERLFAHKAIDSGARGYLMKQNAPLELGNAIRSVLAGEIYLSFEMKSKRP